MIHNLVVSKSVAQDDGTTISPNPSSQEVLLNGGVNVEWAMSIPATIKSSRLSNPLECRVKCLLDEDCTAWKYSSFDTYPANLGNCEILLDDPEQSDGTPSLPFSKILDPLDQFHSTGYVKDFSWEDDNSLICESSCFESAIPQSYGKHARQMATWCEDSQICDSYCDCAVCGAPLMPECQDDKSSAGPGSVWSDLYGIFEDVPSPIQSGKTWGCSSTDFSFGLTEDIEKTLKSDVQACYRACTEDLSCIGYTAVANSEWGGFAPVLCTTHSSITNVIPNPESDDNSHVGFRHCSWTPTADATSSIIMQIQDASLVHLLPPEAKDLGIVIFDGTEFVLDSGPDDIAARRLSSHGYYPYQAVNRWWRFSHVFSSWVQRHMRGGNRRRLEEASENTDGAFNLDDVDSFLQPVALTGRCGMSSFDADDPQCDITCEGDLGKLWVEVYFELNGLPDVDVKSPSIWMPVYITNICTDGETSTQDPGNSTNTNTTTTMTTTTTTTVTTTTLPLDRFVPGLGVRLIDNNFPTLAPEGDSMTVQTCADFCLASVDCGHFEWTGGVCNLLNLTSSIDMFSIEHDENAHLYCEAQCAADAECTEYSYTMPQCLILNAAHEYEVYRPMASLAVAMGPVDADDHVDVVMLTEGFDVFKHVHDFDTSRTPGPLIWKDAVKDAPNPVTLDNFHVNHMTSKCDAGWISHGNMCLQYHQERLSLQAAERHCSDTGAWLYTPETQEDVDKICEITGCTAPADGFPAFGRQLIWTGAKKAKVQLVADSGEDPIPHTYLKAPLGQAMLASDLIYPNRYSSSDSGIGSCLVFDVTTGTLTNSTCNAYCVTPGSKTSEDAVSPSCMLNDVDGRLAVARKPFFCSYSLTGFDASTKPWQVPRTVKYVDPVSQISHCAYTHSDRYGGNLFDFELPNWESCHGSCRDIVTCDRFTFAPPTCNIFKTEADKNWGEALVMSIELDQIDGLTGEAECNRICAGNPECNVRGEFIPGRCYIKSDDSAPPTPTHTPQWINLIHGPVDCNSAPIIEEEIQGCPPGYTLSEDPSLGSLCVAIHWKRTTAIEGARICKLSGGELASARNQNENQLILSAFCQSCQGDNLDGCLDVCVPRGVGTLDGVYYMGLNATSPGLNADWKWVDDTTSLEYPAMFGGHNGTNTLQYFANGTVVSTVQPDNTTGNQMCAYFYPRDHDPENNDPLNGGWGDEDCDSKCLVPPSPNQILTNAPLCMQPGVGGGTYEGREVNLQRFFICTAAPLAQP